MSRHRLIVIGSVFMLSLALAAPAHSNDAPGQLLAACAAGDNQSVGEFVSLLVIDN